MPPADPAPAASAIPHGAPSIFIVIVLYRMAPAHSPSYRTLLHALEQQGAEPPRAQVLLYDNTPAADAPPTLPPFVHYVASPVNNGLATAYTLAIQRAAAAEFDWLLTLDQDTSLPANFFQQLAPLAQALQADHRVAAIVPQVVSGTRVLSPYWLAAGFKPRWFPLGFQGVPGKGVYAVNSAALLRVRAVQQVGGYSPLFWLDASDLYLFRRFEQAGKKVYVAGSIRVQHDLSIADIGTKMSTERYSNALSAGAALYDMEYGSLAGVGHTLQMMYTYLQQRRTRAHPTVYRTTLAAIRNRLYHRRATRLQAWLGTQQRRLTDVHRSEADRGTPSGTPLQQPGVYAVIVLYNMAPADSPALQTLLAAAALVPPSTLHLHIMLYDNSPAHNSAHSLPSNFFPPDSLSPDSLPPNVVYVPSARNCGLSQAYNHAIAAAAQEHFRWMLTLDQDTELPPTFLQTMLAALQHVDADEQVASVLPLVVEGEKVLSPHWFKLDFFPRAFSAATTGVQPHSVYAFNSGAMLRTRALQAIGGYNPLFWLDYSDAYIFRRLHLAGYKGYIAGDTVLQHHLSLLHADSMSQARYRNIVEAGSAFCDLYRGPLVGLQFTYRLLRSYLGQLRRPGTMVRRAILLKTLRSRLLQTRSARVQAWTQQQAQARLAD